MRSKITVVVIVCYSTVLGAEDVDFNRDIRPLLAANCFACHGPDQKERQADLRLDTQEGLYGERDNGVAVVANDLANSELFRRITASDPEERMPPADFNRQLKPEEIEQLRRWIEAGAPFAQHWSFVPPKRHEPPPVNDPSWVRNPVDQFVLASLESEGLKPSPPSDDRTLLRRVTLDLTGLPPTPEEIDEFLAEGSDSAYEEVVERLLSSPRYGERMALDWLDAARYADTFGYHEDYHRDVWAWRDWVIQSFNRNQPFDDFTIDQLAGDLLPEPTTDQLIATGFNRMHGVTSSGIPDEYRVEYDLDRVKTTATVWMGLTIGCAQCHDHKFDPISQKEFYEFYAFFNNVDDPAIMGDKGGNLKPLITYMAPEDQAIFANYNDAIAELVRARDERRVVAGVGFEAWLRTVSSEELVDPCPAVPTDDLAVYYRLDDAAGREVKCQITDRVGTLRGRSPDKMPVWSDGKFGAALKFDGEAWIDLGDAVRFDSADAFSVGAWIFPEKKRGTIVSRMDPSGRGQGWSFVYDQRLRFVITHDGTANSIRGSTQETLKPNEWQHVLFTYDGSKKSSGIKIYVDGKPQQINVSHDHLTGSILVDKSVLIGADHQRQYFKGSIDEVRIYRRALAPLEARALAVPLPHVLAKPAAERTEEEIDILQTYFVENYDDEYGRLTKALDALRVTHEDFRLNATRTMMVMEEMQDLRKTFVLERGQYHQPGEEVARSTPSVLPPLPTGADANRLSLARWLVQPEHPLTARVTVNRHWQLLFGMGIVATQEDFGTQGERPSHPELLDWLAREFVRSEWNIKSLLRLIVTSATYRQSSRVSPELLARDPDNRLLARGARFRLPGEIIRDQALAVSGLLVERVGGPSVRPYQPAGLWVESATRAYQQDVGEGLYRRSLYTYWKRSVPPPNMLVFDAPNRETCSVRRQRTNTPLIALVLMNDPTYVEAASALADRVMVEVKDSASERARWAFRLVTAREPADAEHEVLLRVYREQLAVFQQDESAARELLAVGESTPRGDHDLAEHAAWAAVASLILNLDETITKE